MNCSVHVFLLNDHFSVEYAETHNNGQESELNRKYEWQDELEIKAVSSVEMKENSIYALQGEYGDGSPFSFDVKAMRLFEIQTQTVPAFIGCSESILSSYELDKNDHGYVLKIYLKDFEPMANPIAGIYIASQEFPKELIG